MALCMAVLVQAQTDEISMSVSTPVEDNGDWVVQVSMDNPGQSITTLQFDLSIPEDFSYTAGNYLLTSRATIIRGGREVDTHSVVSGSTTHGGTVRVIIYSPDNVLIKGESGAIVSFYLSGSGTAHATPCNLTNIVATTMTDGVVNSKPSYVQAVINDPELPCADYMDNDLLVIGDLTEMQKMDMNVCILTNPNISLVDLSRCTTANLGLLPLQDENALIICHHEGQVENTVNVVCKSDEGWHSDNMMLDDKLSTYSLPYDLTAEQVQYKRTFNNTNWQALYLPVEIPVEQLTANYDVAEIRRMDEGETNIQVVASTITTGMLEANKPYLIRAHATGEQTLELTDVTLKATSSQTVSYELSDGRVDFTGIYATKGDMYDADAYALTGGTLKKATGNDVKLGCFRWFMTLTSAGSFAKSFVFIVDEATDAVNAVQCTGNDRPIFDLSGRKANMVSPKGYYIQNGKKVLR